MKHNSLARNFASALSAFVKSTDDLERLYQETQDLWDIFADSEAHSLLICKKAAISEKLLLWQTLTATLSAKFTDFTIQAVEFIIRKKAFHLMPQIIKQLRERLYAAQNRVELEVTIADEINGSMMDSGGKHDKKMQGAAHQDLIEAIGRKLGHLSEARLQVNVKVDPSIIGGMQLRVGNKILDFSVRHKLQNLLESI